MLSIRQITVGAALLAAVMATAGCGSGSSSSSQVIEPGPTTVGTVSAPLAKTAILRDVATVRAVVDASESTRMIGQIYAVINRAGAEKSATKGAAILRARIPPLVARFELDYQSTLDRLAALHFRTRAGGQVRRLDVTLLHGWQQVLPQLRSDLATKTYAWDAIVSFGNRNNKLSGRLQRQLSGLLASLPASQRRVLRQAVAQTFGK